MLGHIPNAVWFGSNFKINPFTFANCSIFMFFWYFFHNYSSIVLTLMSVEKFFALYFPLKTKDVCTVSAAKRVIIIATVICLGYYTQIFFIWSPLEDEIGTYCVFVKKYESYEMIFYQIEAVIYSFGPLAIMGFTNAAIIYKFAKAKLESGKGGTASTSQALNKAAVKGTAILVSVSLTFIILTGPVSVTQSVVKIIPPVLDICFRLLYTLNHAINGFLYCIVGSKFRQELMNTLRCRKNSANKFEGSSRKDMMSRTQSSNLSE